MTQFATVDRFCSIEGTSCSKRIPYRGKDTFFFAYPSTRRWQDFSSQLVREMRVRGFDGVRWEDLVNNDLLFSKVCEGIYGNDYLLAEVTEPNPNVLLEIGYSLAVGRLPVLLVHKNSTPWARDLLTTLESCHYETREDIHIYLRRLKAQNASIPNDPNRRLPFLEKMGIFDQPETSATVYHLKPKLSADWISRVDRTLKSSFFKLGTMDPSDSVYDEFYPQARKIQGTSAIVASLLSSTSVDWKQQNANLALLIGFAIGLGKQVLVLQHEPIAPMLDLGSVARPIETEKQAREIVNSWIENQTRLQFTERADANKRAAKRQQVERIRTAYLGHPDALQDNRLLDYFVRTKEFEDAIEGRRTFFIGRRGSGKSANFQAIRAEIHERPKLVPVEIAPDDFELERISTFLGTEYGLSDPRFVFQHIWTYVLSSEILKSLAERTDRLYLSPEDKNRRYLRQFYDDHYGLLSLDFASRVISVLTTVIATNPDITREERQSRADKQIKALRDYELGRRLKEFAEREDITYFGVADDLDKHWRPDNEQSIYLLIGLIAEADRLQRLFQGRLKLVLFLREDIYDVLAQFDDDLPKRNLLRMEWTQPNLRHLVAERLAIAADEANEDDESTWSVIFPEPVQQTKASDYVLSRALPRPRDVLDLCQKAIDQAQRNGHTFVTEQDILDGEATFSEGLFWSLAAEFRGLYPQLEEVLIEFAGIPESLHWKEFERRATDVIQENRTTMADWARGPGGPDPQSFAEILFKIGLIGFSRKLLGPTFYCNGRSFSQTWGRVSPAPIVHIHPAFRKALAVSGGVMNRPWRTKRARRMDPRQLALEELR